MSTEILRGDVNTIPDQISDGRGCRRTHSAEFKAQVVASCLQPGVSIAALAMANGVNANLARRWVVGAEQGALSGERLLGANRVAPPPAFVALQLPCAQPAPDIRIELRRGATAITVHWPSAHTPKPSCASSLMRVERVLANW